ncbi:alpha/beta hydrolase [Paracoccus sp. (in: a-proteobacteria)]|uniref:alpha/beta hydrolase n=1 Tax=Paracoccus sp. TaxID=267 RepID=UPI002AFFF6DC|nr:alpha/beta hydrolase [Paracoccus sp. (in: a-proteobacteria)]
MTSIQRRFVSVNGRQVHYRIAGTGPALLLIHQSPQNSRMWTAMMQRYADRYTVIAPDTPGFGYSDALPGNPMTIAEFGAATLEFCEAIGLQRFAVFGMHTGGLIATWLAWANPARVAALVVDGYAAFTPQESALYGDTYLPPFVPQWDGSHLRWLWSRMREQKYFFPWYDGRAEAAMGIAPQTTEGTREAVMDVLDVGDSYRAGYAAAFRHNDHHWVSELQMPAWLVFRHGDPLLAHMPRLRDLPANVQLVDEPDGIPAMHVKMDGWLARALAAEPPCTVVTPAASPTEWQRRIIDTVAGDLAVWERAGDGPLRLLLHAPGTRPLSPAQSQAGEGAALLPDLPGHGASCESDCELSAEVVVAALLEALHGHPAVLIQAHEVRQPVTCRHWWMRWARVHRAFACTHRGCSMPTNRRCCWTTCRPPPSIALAAICAMPGSGSASATCCGRGCRPAPPHVVAWMHRRLRWCTPTWSSCCVSAAACTRCCAMPPRRGWPRGCVRCHYRCRSAPMPNPISRAAPPRCPPDPEGPP